ncbi:hypothetical protein X801_07767 [Opisthorchis viverrini]|uniref:Uncharacterized protein n=1 Tax=Opisthorchis viverrini TaxID=6198 RepID=A0A1S8WPH1_OPIVI|nr:hypothetical protein X801_07767 [Opisthorchis viverrini]
MFVYVHRAEASLPHLVALNPYVRVSLETNEVTSITAPLASEVNLQLLKPLWNPDEEKTTKVECLIVTQCSLHAATLLNIFCRKHSIRKLTIEEEFPYSKYSTPIRLHWHGISEYPFEFNSITEYRMHARTAVHQFFHLAIECWPFAY